MSSPVLRRPWWAVRVLVLLFAVLSLPACATTGATFGSGVGDALVDEAPFYAGRRLSEVDPSAATGHFPVHYQRGGSHPALFDPELTPAIQSLLDEMTDYLGELGGSELLGEGGRVSAVTHADTRVPPDVRFGCQTETGLPEDDCVERGDSALGRGPQYMLLAVGRPSPEWIAWLGEVMTAQGVERTLVVTLEVGQYWTRQRGIRGTKVVELGTDHEVELPWLTSLETPVTVLQLTGALVGPDGKAIRIGAEGLLARRTPFRASILGAQALIRDEDVAELSRARRDDLPGNPLVWQVALRELVEGLTGKALDGR